VQSNTNGQFSASYGGLLALLSRRKLFESRRLDDLTVYNPIICASVDEAIAFGVSVDHFPVYLKDSLLNTVKDFDFSSFASLEQRLKSSISTDVFVF